MFFSILRWNTKRQKFCFEKENIFFFGIFLKSEKNLNNLMKIPRISRFSDKITLLRYEH